MADTFLGPDWSNPFRLAFRRHSHQLLAWGCEDALPRIKSVESNQDQQEEAITGFIAEAIQSRLKRDDCPRWGGQYCLKEENPVYDKNLTGKRRKKTDIRIECTKNRRPEYVVEAKRLKGSTFGYEKYISLGLKRFIDGMYSPDYPEAILLAYVQSDSTSHWQKIIKTQISNLPDLGLQSEPSEYFSKNDVFTHQLLSQHSRSNRENILLYHFFLDCLIHKNI